MMLSSKFFLHPSPISFLQTNPPFSLLPSPNPIFNSLSFHRKSQSRFLLSAQNNCNGDGNGGGNGNGNENRPQETIDQNQEPKNASSGGNDPFFKNFKWAAQLIDPDPDNILAVGLAGLLTWASVQVLFQLFFISFAILVAALKYSFVAALLLFILITLL